MAENNTTSNSTLSPTFRYRHVLEKGKPVHKDDLLSIRHPAMPLSQRAKIFSPFAALKGYDEEIAKVQAEALERFNDEKGPAEEYP